MLGVTNNVDASSRSDVGAGSSRRIASSRSVSGSISPSWRVRADPGPLVTTWLAEEQRAGSTRARQDGLIEPLTDRELAILRLLPAPSSLRELASTLFVTPNTLKTHLRAIYRKLGAESREEAVICARDRGLL